jgi:hypothetical protein
MLEMIAATTAPVAALAAIAFTVRALRAEFAAPKAPEFAWQAAHPVGNLNDGEHVRVGLENF